LREDFQAAFEQGAEGFVHAGPSDAVLRGDIAGANHINEEFPFVVFDGSNSPDSRVILLGASGIGFEADEHPVAEDADGFVAVLVLEFFKASGDVVEGNDGGGRIEGEAIVFADDHRALDIGEFSGVVFGMRTEQFACSFFTGFNGDEALPVIDGGGLLVESDSGVFAFAFGFGDAPSGEFGFGAGTIGGDVLHHAALGEREGKFLFKGRIEIDHLKLGFSR